MSGGQFGYDDFRGFLALATPNGLSKAVGPPHDRGITAYIELESP